MESQNNKQRPKSPSDASTDSNQSHIPSKKSSIGQQVTILQELSKTDPNHSYYKVAVSRSGTKTSTSHDSTRATVITAVLKDLQEDVIMSRFSQPPVKSDEEPIQDFKITGRDNVYVQNRSGFVVTPRERALTQNTTMRSTHQDWMEDLTDTTRETPLDVAIQVQSMFTPISGICFGLLGGIAVFQLILAFSLSMGMDGSEGLVFLESYSKIARIAPIAFYILLAFCIVSVFDRFDLAHLDMNHCIELLAYRQSWAIAIIYILVLLSTLMCAYYDDLLILYPHDKSFTLNKYQLSQSLYEWQLWNTCRTILAVVGWVVFSLTMPDDLLLHHLQNIKQYERPDKPVFIVQSSNAS
uniref:Uncharacterized protein n=1 Tax=Clastoptera arizonana TaxID=38151 RepID=A0A1B6EGB3_9HEMI